MPAKEPGFDDAMALLTDNVVAAILDDKSALDRFEPTQLVLISTLLMDKARRRPESDPHIATLLRAAKHVLEVAAERNRQSAQGQA
jgi:hypothetical protein